MAFATRRFEGVTVIYTGCKNGDRKKQKCSIFLAPLVVSNVTQKIAITRFSERVTEVLTPYPFFSVPQNSRVQMVAAGLPH